MNRRDFLASSGVLCATSLVTGFELGRRSRRNVDDDEPDYPALKYTPVYLGPGINASLPDDAIVIDDPVDATVAVVAHDTPKVPTTVVDWLEAGTAVGTIRRPAATKLGELLGTGNVTEAFPDASTLVGQGSSDEEPTDDETPADAEDNPPNATVVYPEGDELVSSVGTVASRGPPEDPQPPSTGALINTVVVAAIDMIEPVHMY